MFEVTASYKFTLLEEAHGVCKLLIYKPSNRDAGQYICRANNSSGEAQIVHTIEVAKNKHYHPRGIFHARDRIQLDKEKTARRAMEEALQSKAESDKRRAEMAPPRSAPEPMVSPKNRLYFATQLRDRTAIEGSTLKLQCNVIGPGPSCRWLKDDNFVTVGPNINNLTEEGKAILVLSNVNSEVSGIYKCVARNEHCQVETSCYVKIYAAQADGDEQEPMFTLPLRGTFSFFMYFATFNI